MPREGKAANPFHSLAALQKLAHQDSFWSIKTLSELNQLVIEFTAPFLNHTPTWDRRNVDWPELGLPTKTVPVHHQALPNDSFTLATSHEKKRIRPDNNTVPAPRAIQSGC
jgi:hypothetical protein